MMHRMRRLTVRRLIDLARCQLTIRWLRLIRRFYGFDEWHAGAPYICRPYKAVVVKTVDDLAPACVVEVGCGLGEIVSRTAAAERHGYDIDPSVVRAARRLHGRRTTFHVGGLDQVQERSIDVLILVNWIHGVSPGALDALLTPILRRTRYLVVDAIDTEGPVSYRYKHDFAMLSGRADLLSSTRPPDEPRTIRVYRTIMGVSE